MINQYSDVREFKIYCKYLNEDWLQVGALLYMKKSTEDAAQKIRYKQFAEIAMSELEERGICIEKLKAKLKKFNKEKS